MFDVCVIGHVTWDHISIPGYSTTRSPGGVAYYTAIALRNLGLETAVITRMARSDTVPLLHELKSVGAVVFCSSSKTTTVFENSYSDNTLDIRDQKLRSVASGFRRRDLNSVSANIFHIGPLTHGDMSSAFLGDVAARGGKVSLDVQGLLRLARDDRIILTDWKQKRKGLGYVDILKADQKEAQILSDRHDPEEAARVLSSFGPPEVIITLGSRGSIIVCDGRTYRIPAFPPRRVVDATGCGDTYVAGYLAQRLISDDIGRAGRFAAALATLKLESSGPFQGSHGEVEALLGKPSHVRGGA